MIETLILFTALAFVFFLPGWFILRLIYKRFFTPLEEVLVSFAIGLTLLNALTLLLDHLALSLSLKTLGMSLGLINFILFLWWYQQRKTIPPQPSTQATLLSTRTWGILLVMLMLTIGLKAYYLIPAGLPTATDMGHHMYWSKFIAEKHELPTYQKVEVVTNPVSGLSSITSPQPIADFIIGEHIPFGIIAILSGLSFIGSFPVLTLLFVNLLSVLAVLALTIQLNTLFSKPREHAWFVIGTFLFIGPLFALASPQAKFVSGGVVGNLFGNFFIPLILLVFYLGLREKNSRLIALGILFTGTLAYTHHLSTLVLGFLLVGMGIITSLILWKDLWPTLKNWSKVIFTAPVGLVITGLLFFLLFVAVPSYLDREAIDSAIGSPIKTTRTGLTFFQVSNSLGITKAAFAIAGFVLLLVHWNKNRRDPLGLALMVGWGLMLTLMATKPHWLFLDIPSNRVGSYLIYPAALIAGYGFAVLLSNLETARKRLGLVLLSFIICVLILSNGVFENGASLVTTEKSIEAQEVFAASQFLSKHTTQNDIILKDHNYLAADAWMKLFFLRDYSYPLSRGLFSRYEETGSRRERCTLVMIASPNGEEARKCFEGTGTNYIVVNPTFDAVQFEKSGGFTKVYASEHVAVFKRLQD